MYERLFGGSAVGKLNRDNFQRCDVILNTALEKIEECEWAKEFTGLLMAVRRHMETRVRYNWDQ